MKQDFIVTWVNSLDTDRFRMFDSLAEAEEFMSGLKIEESYVYLSIVIKKQ